MTDALPNISTGDFTLTADCPECHRKVVLPVSFSVVLTVDPEVGYLRARLSTKRVEHSCSGEHQPPMFEGNGAPPFDTAGDPDDEDDPFDAPERITVVNLPGD